MAKQVDRRKHGEWISQEPQWIHRRNLVWIRRRLFQYQKQWRRLDRQYRRHRSAQHGAAGRITESYIECLITFKNTIADECDKERLGRLSLVKCECTCSCGVIGAGGSSPVAG